MLKHSKIYGFQAIGNGSQLSGAAINRQETETMTASLSGPWGRPLKHIKFVFYDSLSSLMLRILAMRLAIAKESLLLPLS